MLNMLIFHTVNSAVRTVSSQFQQNRAERRASMRMTQRDGVQPPHVKVKVVMVAPHPAAPEHLGSSGAHASGGGVPLPVTEVSQRRSTLSSQFSITSAAGQSAELHKPKKAKKKIEVMAFLFFSSGSFRRIYFFHLNALCMLCLVTSATLRAFYNLDIFTSVWVVALMGTFIVDLILLWLALAKMHFVVSELEKDMQTVKEKARAAAHLQFSSNSNNLHSCRCCPTKTTRKCWQLN